MRIVYRQPITMGMSKSDANIEIQKTKKHLQEIGIRKVDGRIVSEPKDEPSPYDPQDPLDILPSQT